MNHKLVKHFLMSKDACNVLVERGNEETYYLTDGTAMWRWHSPLATLPEALVKLNLGIPDLAVGETYKFNRATKTWKSSVSPQPHVCDQTWHNQEEQRHVYVRRSLLATPWNGGCAIWFQAIGNDQDGVFLDQKYLAVLEDTGAVNSSVATRLNPETGQRGLNDPVEISYGFGLESLTMLLCPVVIAANYLGELRKQAHAFGREPSGGD